MPESWPTTHKGSILTAFQLQNAERGLRLALGNETDESNRVELAAVLVAIKKALKTVRENIDKSGNWTTDDAARMIGVHSSRVRQVVGPAAAAGQLEPADDAYPRRFTPSSLVEVLAAHGLRPTGAWQGP